MSEKSYQFITSEIQSGTGIITINRPEVYNALNFDGKWEIIKCIKEFNQSNDIKSIILTGNGRAFCSGQDLNDRTIKESATKVDIGHTLITEWNPLVQSIRQSEKIVIASINGVCAGAGLAVALSCDLKIMQENTKLMCGFTQIGPTLDAGLSYVLTRAMGIARATEFALFGGQLGASEAKTLGLVNEICADPMVKSLEWANKVNQLPPLSVKMAKKNLNRALDLSFDENLQFEISAQRYLGLSKDFTEGVSAFLEKRKPEFKGQ